MKVTLIGSARNEDAFHLMNKELTLAGHVVFSLACFPSVEGEKNWYTPAQKEMLDLAHLAKIEESDAVVLLNIDGYYGESTAREIRWARMRGKPIHSVEPAPGMGFSDLIDLSVTRSFFLHKLGTLRAQSEVNA